MTRTTISAALEDLLLHPDPSVEEAVDRHFAPHYRQRTDGAWSSRREFVEHIRHLRAVVVAGTLEVQEELTGGALYAERHTVELTKTDRSVVRMEVYVFGEYAADGRFSRIEETTLMLAGGESDRGLGSAR